VVDFYDRGHGVEVDPFLRAFRLRTEPKSMRLRRFGLALKRLARRAPR
jgi:hypothetical protein